MQRVRRALQRATLPALALLTAFVLGAVMIVLTDLDHLGRLGTDPVVALGGALGGLVEGYAAMLAGALGDPGRIVAAIQSGRPADVERALRPVSETLVSATPFMFAGLGLAVSFRAGLFNLGVDGQFVLGGVGTVIAAGLVAGSLPPPVALLVAVVGGTAAGAAYAFVPGLLKARTGAHEVITTVMLNGMASSVAFLIAGLVDLPGPRGPLPAVPRLIALRTIRVDYGFVVALAMAVVVSVLLFRTTLGFELRTTGFSRTAARAAGIRSDRATILAMSLSGALVGMASAFYLLGPTLGSFSEPSPDFGYVAIALALLAGRRPAGVVAVAVLYGALDTGGKSMAIATGIPLALLTVVAALAILFVAAPDLTRSIWRRPRPANAADPRAGPARSA